jgi:hypothetical protein
MVPTAMSQRNTSAVSTRGRSGEYNCTETEEIEKGKHTFQQLNCQTKSPTQKKNVEVRHAFLN